MSRFLLPQSLGSIALYGKENKLKLPFGSLNKEFRVARAQEELRCRDSTDPKASQAGTEVRTGRKWKAAEAVSSAESWLRHRVLGELWLVGRRALTLAQHFATTRHEGKSGC